MHVMNSSEDHHDEGTSSGPFSFLNPTERRAPLPAQRDPGHERFLKSEGGEDEPEQENNDIRADDVRSKWRSRDNRKGRHAIAVTPEMSNDSRYLTPPSTSTLKEILRGIWRMFSEYPYWDVSYLVAIVFTLGSVVWCINAFFVWLPLEDPASEFPGEITDAGGWSAFVGATIFEFGSVLLMLEAVNENRADCFGWALEEALEEEGLLRLRPSSTCVHHHQNKGNLVGQGKATDGKLPLDSSMDSENQPDPKSARSWTWWPTWHELSTHYIKEIGFLACSAQMFGATIFWISGFTAIPGIYDRLTTTADQNGAYWVPQVVGGSGFIVSGTLFMLETQKKWYLPAWTVLGWHIGVWNLIGGIGFTLCGALGFAAANSGAAYEGSLATFWGSWCFLIGSVIQWYEALDKHPVDIEVSGGKVSDIQPVA